jgi:hypothetical protein
VCEALATLLPLIATRYFTICCGIDAWVVVDDYLLMAHATLARKKHRGTSALEHRHKIGDNKTLRKEILHRKPQRGALPAPSASLRLPYSTMALPEGYMAICESLGRLRGRTYAGDERWLLTIGEETILYIIISSNEALHGLAVDI